MINYQFFDLNNSNNNKIIKNGQRYFGYYSDIKYCIRKL